MSLTPRRLERITPILETYRGKLRASGAFRPESLEAEIKATLDVGYQEVKHLLIDLLKKPRYQTVAAYYLQHFAAQTSRAKPSSHWEICTASATTNTPTGRKPRTPGGPRRWISSGLRLTDGNYRLRRWRRYFAAGFFADRDPFRRELRDDCVARSAQEAHATG